MALSLTERIKEKALALGFDLVGFAPAGRALHADSYASWVDAGYAGAMGYMVRSPEKRQDIRQVMAGAQSVVVVGVSYFSVEPPADLWDDPSRGRIARFAWGPDYHDLMTPRLRELADFIAREGRREIEYKVYVDTGPVLERDVAVRAGMGFFGKNSCLVNPRLGSYLFLGEILLDRDLEIEPETGSGANSHSTGQGQSGDPTKPGARRREIGCGSCSSCLDACPTGALVSPYVLDSKRCISYLTIELKTSIPENLRGLMGNWVFGCDECQSVCPWPRRFSSPGRLSFLGFSVEESIPRLVDLVKMDSGQFRAMFGISPLLRSRRRGLVRNAVVALTNWGSPEAVPALELACEDREALVREHAAWGLQQLGGKRSDA